eukprot:scaffold323535_cov19-Prasinocladus_malaysianus.AAC.1
MMGVPARAHSGSLWRRKRSEACSRTCAMYSNEWHERSTPNRTTIALQAQYEQDGDFLLATWPQFHSKERNMQMRSV